MSHRPALAVLLVTAAITAVTIGACGGSSKPAPVAPLPDENAAAEPTRGEPAEQQPPAEPAEPAPPPPPPFAEAPPPGPPGAPKAHVAKALAIIPQGPTILIGADIPRLATTPFGDKVVAALAKGDVPASCKRLTAAQFGNVVFGAGGGEMVGVFDGKVPERNAVACIEAALKAQGGAKLEQKKIKGHTVRFATGDDTNNGWVAWSKGVAILGTSEIAITGALDPKAAKLTGGDLAALAAKADQGHMLWGVMKLPADQLAAMGMPGDVSGDVTVRGWVDIGTETDIDLVFGFATPEEAARMTEQIRTMLTPMRAAPDVEKILGKLRLGVHGSELHAVLHLDAAATKELVDEFELD